MHAFARAWVGVGDALIAGGDVTAAMADFDEVMRLLADGVTRDMRQQRELQAAQRDWSRADGDLVRGGVDPQLPVFDHARFLGEVAPHERLHPRALK